ncbi:hypothetical protein [Micromonospora carbonacea]|uniref:Secreted protein n=1 Tax=Micromonospora carbonacea TaxID=47853 RepID=A0A1C4WVR7_9ACTN|nr:hypothetical protein [Micromonospora carbonacea]SCF00268.1 hypothetical protein GA0070563_10459 [Micromonospora carbonacea]
MMLKVYRPRTALTRIGAGLVLCLVASLLAAGSSAGATERARGDAAQQAQTAGSSGGVVAAVPVQARYSPLGATANGPSGPATARFTATPYCCPSTAVVLTPSQVSTETDFQWAILGLPWDNTSISSVSVCYAISTAVTGRTYLSQTRLTDMTLPNSATVMLDDGTDRTAVGPACYTVPASFTPTGSVALGLKVVFGSTSDRITIGLVSLSGLSA